ncbi:hypothetical protein Naga_101537g1 [Nannochloropsis gaditana]|uniref:Uncharacterized protein n=1 Tax=Nannochloropsis gaditana TaxID=72520 RepID=W7TZI3_9STRA|nr:hypothetical protein Naga_101537g1 [Nannochloropsis gaditana]
MWEKQYHGLCDRQAPFPYPSAPSCQLKMPDVESIKSPARSPGKPQGPDPLLSVASQPTKFQVGRSTFL